MDIDPYCNISSHIMKTTIELPDDLLIEAKAVAARRRTTLKEIITRSLRREIGMAKTPALLSIESPFEIGELGLPVLKKRGRIVTSEGIRQAINEADQEDYQRTLQIAQGQ
jgi:hypothetical protein